MKKLFLTANITTGAVRLAGGLGLPAEGLRVMHGDVALLCVSFVETIPAAAGGTGAETAVDFTAGGAPQALRFTADAARTEAATLQTFQDDYNAGLWGSESLANGRVSWLVDFGASPITATLSTSESASIWGEFSLLTAAGYPQTLAQLKIAVYAQIDNGAVGSPPPSSPTYQTAADALTDYALNPSVTELAATGSLTGSARRHLYLLDTGGGAVELTLPALSGVSAAYRPTIILETAGNNLTLTPAGSDTINGGASMVIATQYAGVELIPDKTNTNWIAVTAATP